MKNNRNRFRFAKVLLFLSRDLLYLLRKAGSYQPTKAENGRIGVLFCHSLIFPSPISLSWERLSLVRALWARLPCWWAVASNCRVWQLPPLNKVSAPLHSLLCHLLPIHLLIGLKLLHLKLYHLFMLLGPSLP